MNPAKIDASDYINFLIATPRTYTCTEAERVQPTDAAGPAHDAFTRLLHRLEPEPNTLWAEAEPQVQRTRGILILDDSTLDKLYARKIELVGRHWSGKHHRVVDGINLVTLLWSDGERHIPCDYRLFAKATDGATKNDHFRAMLAEAHARGFQPRCVAFDSWYSSLDNLKRIRTNGWTWLTQLKCNRLVNPDGQGNRAVNEVALNETGTVVHLKGYGLVKVFKIVAKNGDIGYWATNDLTLTALQRLQYSEWAWAIETYHRGIKQFCGIERCQARAARAQRIHIGLALRAFLRLEAFCFRSGISWFEAKTAIIREAVRAYLANPLYTLTPTA